MTTTNDKNTATLIHLSAFSQWVIPFGNFIFPIILWSALKEKSAYINEQGKQAINFQLSLFLYSLILVLIAAPIFIITLLRGIEISEISNNHEIIMERFLSGHMSTTLWIGIMAVVLFIFLHVIESFLILYAAVKTSNGAYFKYPLTIPFLKPEAYDNNDTEEPKVSENEAMVSTE